MGGPGSGRRVGLNLMERIKALLRRDGALKPRQVAERLGISLSHAYKILTRIKIGAMP